MPDYAELRQKEILSKLERDQAVSVADLAEALDVSKVTIRADLDALAKDGKLRRTHGGAISLTRTVVASLQDARINVNVEAKRAIAKLAKSFIEPNMSVLIDTGTTGLELVRQLGNVQNLTIVTADLSIADYVDKAMPHSNVILLGGMLYKGHRYTSGKLTLETLAMLAPDISFICPTAVSTKAGLLTNHEATAELKAQFLLAGDTHIVLADSSKINSSGLYKFGTLDAADYFISEQDEKGQLAAALEDSSCDLLLATH